MKPLVVITEYQNSPDTYFVHIQVDAAEFVFNGGEFKFIMFHYYLCGYLPLYHKKIAALSDG